MFASVNHGAAALPVVSGYLVKSPPISRADSPTFKKWHRRFFVLWEPVDVSSTSTLRYYEDERMTHEIGAIPLGGKPDPFKVYRVESKKFKHVFSIPTPNRIYFLSAKSNEECEWWCDVLNDAIRRDTEYKRAQKRKTGIPTGITLRQMWRMCRKDSVDSEVSNRHESVYYTDLSFFAKLEPPAETKPHETKRTEPIYTCIDISKTLALKAAVTRGVEENPESPGRATRHDLESESEQENQDEEPLTSADLDLVDECNDLLRALEDGEEEDQKKSKSKADDTETV